MQLPRAARCLRRTLAAGGSGATLCVVVRLVRRMSLALELHALTKTFRGPEAIVPVLREVSFELSMGQSLALTGESGSGKSTLLHVCAGLEPFDAGEVRVCGTSLRGLGESECAALRRTKVGLVFQAFNLVPSLTVAQNLALHARLAHCHDPALAGRLATRLGLDGLLHRYPEQLSGGQQQRVAIGRALAMRPRLVLADEPTGNLDESTGDSVLSIMQELCADTGAALLVVTHSTRLAACLDRHLHLRAGRLEHRR